MQGNITTLQILEHQGIYYLVTKQCDKYAVKISITDHCMSIGTSFSSKSVQTLFFNEATGHVGKMWFKDKAISPAATFKLILYFLTLVLVIITRHTMLNVILQHPVVYETQSVTYYAYIANDEK